MDVPEKIAKAIAAVGGEIARARPMCDGSTHWIVEFTASGSVSRGKLAGEDSLARIGRPESGATIYRAHFTRLTPEK